MCRALLYLGRPVLLDHLLFQPDSALVTQTFMPKMLHMLNLAGFGMMAWDEGSIDPARPYRYSSTDLPFFDRNLKSLALKLHPHCLLAHVRGVGYGVHADISHQNTHPFCFDGYRIALAHNGDLHRIKELKPDLLKYIKPEIARHIAGSTDTEWVYALLLSQLAEPQGPSDRDELGEAVVATLSIIGKLRRHHGIDTSSSVNLFISNGTIVMAVRFCFDFGRYSVDIPGRVHEANLSYLSLWYTTGREFGLHEDEWKMIGGEETADSLIIASEPLTRDTTTWLEVPPYSLLCADIRGVRPSITHLPLQI